jgi:hypothetical protein
MPLAAAAHLRAVSGAGMDFCDPPTIPCCNGSADQAQADQADQADQASIRTPRGEFDVCGVLGCVPDRLMGSHGSVLGDRPPTFQVGGVVQPGPGT